MMELRRDQDDDFDPLCALIVKADSESPTVDNLKRRLRAPTSNGGCQLLVKVVKKPSNGKNEAKTALLVGCDNERLLKEAELRGINKVGPHGDMIPFTWDSHAHHDILGEDPTCEAMANRFSQSEKLRLLSQILDRLRVSTEDMNAVDEVPLIYVAVPHLRSQGIVTDVFPLHDHYTLNRLKSSWYHTWSYEQPYDGIRDYFGEKIAVYFAFLSFYTKALIICTALAVIYYFAFSGFAHAQAVFAAINLVILTLFLKLWRRRCAILAYYWGTFQFVKYEFPRPEFKGRMELSSVTGLPEPVYPSWRRWRIIIFISYPIVIIWLAVAVFIIWLYFWVQFRVDAIYLDYHFVPGYIIYYLPTIVYCIIIEILNRLYKRTAVFLTNLQNHRLQSEYENHLLTKLILFQFVNCFGWLFYVAFVQRDMEGLKRYLACILITLQILQQLQECVLPYFRIKILKRFSDQSNLSFDAARVFNEEALDVYEDTFYDYLELWLQFGYAFLFSSVYPMAAFWALLNNISEMRCDAFKLCKSMRRPFPQSADSIGPWQTAFDALVAVSVITNCALLGLSDTFQKYFSNWTSMQRVLIVVLIEHMIILVIVCIHKLIHNLPERIHIRLARVDYSAMKALAQQLNSYVIDRQRSKPKNIHDHICQRAETVAKRPPFSRRHLSVSDDIADHESYRAATAHRSAEV